MSPYYFYSTKINKFLAEYIQKHKIRFAAAYPIRPGVHRKAFYPQSLEDLESERNFVNNSSGAIRVQLDWEKQFEDW